MMLVSVQILVIIYLDLHSYLATKLNNFLLLTKTNTKFEVAAGKLNQKKFYLLQY